MSCDTIVPSLRSLMLLTIFCTNYTAEYDLFIRATTIETSNDSLSVMQQCSWFTNFDESLVIYFGACLDVILTLDYFVIAHISRRENWKAKEIGSINIRLFNVPQGPMLCFANIGKAGLKFITSATYKRSSAGTINTYRIWKKVEYDCSAGDLQVRIIWWWFLLPNGPVILFWKAWVKTNEDRCGE